MIHTDKGFGLVNKAEVNVFLEFDLMGVGNLISGSSAFSKSILNIWKFLVHVLLKPGLEIFEHYFASVWEEGHCVVEGDNRGQDGWMASPTQWTWVWASPGRWRKTGKPCVLQSMGVTKSQTWLSDWTATTSTTLLIQIFWLNCQILALCALIMNRNMETESWRGRKEWLYFFARQRGNTVG